MVPVMILTAAIEALALGTELVAVLDNLNAVRTRMKQEGRSEPTDAELDEVRGRVAARQERIDRG